MFEWKTPTSREKKISEFEDREFEIIELEAQKEKRMKKNEHRVADLRDIIE